MYTKGVNMSSEKGPIAGVEEIEIDFLILADWAENINGKLYIQGAGWDRKRQPPEGQPIDFHVAAGILVPWNLTNQQHQIALSLESDDGTQIGNVLNGGFTTGRPANATPGQHTRVPFAGRIATKPVELGAYRVKLAVNDDVVKTVTFYMVAKL